MIEEKKLDDDAIALENMQDAIKEINNLFPDNMKSKFDEILLSLTDYGLIYHSEVNKILSMYKEVIDIPEKITLRLKLLIVMTNDILKRWSYEKKKVIELEGTINLLKDRLDNLTKESKTTEKDVKEQPVE